MNFKGRLKVLFYLAKMGVLTGLHLIKNPGKYNGQTVMIRVLTISEYKYEYPKVDFDLVCDSTYHNLIKEFVESLKVNFNIDMNKVNYQLSDLKIVQKKLKGHMGEYDSYTNTIDIDPKYAYDKNTVFHELLHAVSCVYIDNLDIGGFETSNGVISLGMGINEGYTSYLCQKLTGDSDNSYVVLKNFAAKLEIILGPEIMQKCYFESAPRTLINEICKSGTTISAVTEFMHNMDFIRAYIATKPEEVKERIRYCEEFLLRLLVQKNKQSPLSDEKLDAYEELLITLINSEEGQDIFTPEERLKIVESEKEVELDDIKLVTGPIEYKLISTEPKKKLLKKR